MTSKARVADRPDTPAPAAAPTPWWRVKVMWLVLGGPLAVVVAGFITLGLAVHGQDTVLPTTSGQAAK